jgi:hypothetical protein
MLHISRADLEHIGILRDDIELFKADDFSYDGKAGFFACLYEHFEALFTKPLKCVGACARFIRTSAKADTTGGLYGLGGFEQ